MIIPFFIPHAACPHRCVFCDQRRISGKHTGPDPASIAHTIARYLSSCRSDGPVEVAFFGGTFTALPLDRQRAYLGPVQPLIVAGAVRSIRVSTRPDALGREVLALLHQHQVATIEIGVQSLDEEVLLRSGRGHGADDVVRAVHALKQERFTVGMQLMPGLPGDTPDRFRMTVERTLSLRPDFVRLYPAVVIKGTPLEELYRSGAYAPLSREDAVNWCADTLDRFGQAGIPVVRVGLQSTEELDRPGTIVAGPYHPAFRQLVESARFLGRMRRSMHPGAEPAFLVHPADLGTAIGHRKGNLCSLRDLFGKDAAILPDPGIPRGTVALRRHPGAPATG